MSDRGDMLEAELTNRIKEQLAQSEKTDGMKQFIVEVKVSILYSILFISYHHHNLYEPFTYISLDIIAI
jgi:hypothetical protein